MPKLYSNPWKDRVGWKSKVKYRIREQFYKLLLRKYCRDCKTVLDVACGFGQFMKTASKMGYKAYGVDADEKHRAKNVTISDLWKFKGKKYDVVFNSMIIEHTFEQEAFVKKMCSLSNDIVITMSAYLTRGFYDIPDHKKPVTRKGLKWMFRRNGFRTLLAIHVPFYKAVIVVSKKVTPKDNDAESVKIRQGFW